MAQATGASVNRAFVGSPRHRQDRAYGWAAERPFVRHLKAVATVKSTMNAYRAEDVTELLRAWSDGDRRALDGLTPIVYAELRRLAHRYMKRERPDHSLQATALINEAYLRLVDCTRMQWKDRAHGPVDAPDSGRPCKTK